MSDDKTAVPVSYDYDDEAAGHAEDFANRIDKSDAFIGKYTNVWEIKSAQKGTNGLQFEFESGGGETGTFKLWTSSAEGVKFFGHNMVMAMMLLMGIKGMKPKKAKVPGYDAEGKGAEVDANTFPDLCGKTIGVVLQREAYNREDNGALAHRLNMVASFHPESRLTASEIKEKQKEPKKLDKILRTVQGKDKDSRTAKVGEPAQPSQAVPAGDY